MLLKCKSAVIRIPLKLSDFCKWVFYWIMIYSSNVSPEILAAKADLLNKNKSLLFLGFVDKGDVVLQNYENKCFLSTVLLF